MTETKTPKAAKSVGTEYVVLSVIVVDEQDDTSYSLVGTITANDDKQAIGKILGPEPSPGNYVAIPARSFKVRGVRSEIETRITVA